MGCGASKAPEGVYAVHNNPTVIIHTSLILTGQKEEFMTSVSAAAARCLNKLESSVAVCVMVRPVVYF